MIHNVRIVNDKFEPAYLRIQRGEVVQWALDCNEKKEVDDDSMSSLYHCGRRMHVISFDTLNEESNPLKDEKDTFKVRFFQTGLFSYRGSIYTRIKGAIEVFDPYQRSSSPPREPIKQISFIDDVSNYLMQNNKLEEGRMQIKSRGQSQKGSSERSLSVYR